MNSLNIIAHPRYRYLEIHPMADTKSGQAQFTGGKGSLGFELARLPLAKRDIELKVSPMAKSATALIKTLSPVTSTVLSIAALFTAVKAVLRPKSDSIYIKI